MEIVLTMLFIAATLLVTGHPLRGGAHAARRVRGLPVAEIQARLMRERGAVPVRGW
ncbi:hypothetical protein OHB26_12035 [Nocardia sp. NBC_01503]|uniref:hypothetical protein n=1 Tax=Nocardia sp. NBC_01503 TaxID=2975997 RepID=UPI002E7BF715|nr:hypothetical protein [Nocardia sp. NBC_01503]WTL34854.1 hypothetical protein OHB26_12035 [Nocardia sp. NBC_01503]